MAPPSGLGPAESPRKVRAASVGADRVFGLTLRGAGLAVLITITGIGLFLLYKGSSALAEDGLKFLTTQAWETDSHNFGIAAEIPGTLLIAVVAVIFAVPLATGVALYISEYAPRRLRQTLINLVDLMAAVPSIVYGLWGVYFLQQRVIPVAKWISTTFGWFPPLAIHGVNPDDPLQTPTVYENSTFIAGIVVALMIMPIVSSLMRESFAQAPVGEREGAYALGATRWGMIRSVVLPFGWGGMIGGTMLGLGRAMGETIAVYMVISPAPRLQPEILRSGANSVSALIASKFGAASPFGLSALFAAGLALFMLSLVVNFGASAVIARTRSGQLSDA
ncbi:MAG: phosphate ABC transporter permease subunit PstC [Pseudonocardiales bacterium]|nr:phosphate ABC transporter permease subunit PstC [Pseudonocardiales bacterium]MBV9032609.1 phosphate ABC transporter permease subunit PstC [Pseudonocardiales bacterium]